MQKRGRKSSKNNGTFARLRRTRAARAGLVGSRGAEVVSIPPCAKLMQSSALEVAIYIKITHGGIDTASFADSA